MRGRARSRRIRRRYTACAAPPSHPPLPGFGVGAAADGFAGAGLPAAACACRLPAARSGGCRCPGSERRNCAHRQTAVRAGTGGAGLRGRPGLSPAISPVGGWPVVLAAPRPAPAPAGPPGGASASPAAPPPRPGPVPPPCLLPPCTWPPTLRGGRAPAPPRRRPGCAARDRLERWPALYPADLLALRRCRMSPIACGGGGRPAPARAAARRPRPLLLPARRWPVLSHAMRTRVRAENSSASRMKIASASQIKAKVTILSGPRHFAVKHHRQQEHQRRANILEEAQRGETQARRRHR